MLHLAFTERALLADEMGLGKTVQAIAACQLLCQVHGIQRVLVVTTASLKAEWEEQINKFTDRKSTIIIGTRAARLKQYQQDSFFYLMNYEQIVADYEAIQKHLAPDVVILDEAQRIKNWRTKTATAVKELKSRFAFVLTGTPIENRIDDIYSIVQFLDPHVFGSLFRFNRDFYEFDEKGQPSGYKNLDVLYRRLRPVMRCRTKQDVEGELPKRLNNNYFVEMEQEQRVRYEEYQTRVARLMHQAKSRPLRKEEFERLQKWLACMRMVCDSPYILDEKCSISPKIKELEQVLNELLEDPTTKIIIFSEWERMLQLVRDMVSEKALDIAWHTGTVSQSKRREMINRFKTEENCRLFLSTDSGSVGLNLQAANVVINLDLPWNPAKLEQRIARAWRKHQTRSVQVINLVCSNSIEHRMLHLLEQKQLMAKGALTGDEKLKSMKMPSGRKAFMERMDSLMSDTQQESDSLKQDNAEEEIKEQSITLDTLDKETLAIIKKLEKAGLLTINQQVNKTLQKENEDELLKQRHRQQLEQSTQQLQKAQRNQRLAQVLIEGDFEEEAKKPLTEGLNHSVKAFFHLIDKEQTQLSKESLNTLILKYNGPKKILNLFSSLIDMDTESPAIKILHDDHQKVLNHLEMMKKSLSLKCN